MRTDLLEIVRDGPVWRVFAVSASDPTDRELVNIWLVEGQANNFIARLIALDATTTR